MQMIILFLKDLRSKSPSWSNIQKSWFVDRVLKNYLEQICSDYVNVCEEATGYKVHLRKVTTPFLPEDSKTARCSILLGEGKAATCPSCRHTFPASIIDDDPNHEDDDRFESPVVE